MRKLIKALRKACQYCYGTGNKELPNGSVTDCRICKGKGLI